MLNNKISIIGGAGFLGTKTSKVFEENNINHKSYDLIPGNKVDYIDVEDIDSLNILNGSSIIINLAAVHRDDVKPISRYDDVNVQGAINICNAAEKFNINKIIFTSSVAIYGFAPPNTDESGKPNYFNDYGRTKYLAENVYKEWQSKDPANRSLVIIRPTVIFGEGNRGNVYNLLKQIASKNFIMFGNGKNIKSLAYVENVARFIIHTTSLNTGIHVYNYIDKPDFEMNKFVITARKYLFNKNNIGIRLPSFLGILIGYLADVISFLISKPLPVSLIRVKKFMGTTQFSSSASQTGFKPSVSLDEALARTIKYEFIEDNTKQPTFESE